MTSLGEELSADLAAGIAGYDQSFTWKNRAWPCVMNHATSTLLVSKSLFPLRAVGPNGSEAGATYPSIGDAIIIGQSGSGPGKKRQVKALENSGLELVPGGTRETKPFVDNPGSPGLLIEFGTFTK
jgi:hypothetical protein